MRILNVGKSLSASGEFLRGVAVDMGSCPESKHQIENAPPTTLAQAWAAQNQTAILAYNDMVAERGVFSDHVRSF